MFPEPTKFLLIGHRNESIWTPKSKSNTLTPKTISQTYWPREISHAMNVIIFCVCLTLAISVLQTVLKWCRKKNAKIFRWRKSHSKIEANDEFGLAMQRKEQHQRTGRLVLDAYSSRYSGWNADKNWSSQEWKSDELMEVRTGGLVYEQVTRFVHTAHGQIYCWWRWYGFWHRRRIRHVVKSLDHSCTGWMVECERFKTNPEKMQHKTVTNILYGKCLCLMGRSTRKIYIHQKYRKRSHHQTDVRHIWKSW